MPGELLSIPEFASEDEERVDAQRAVEADPCLDAGFGVHCPATIRDATARPTLMISQ